MSYQIEVKDPEQRVTYSSSARTRIRDVLELVNSELEMSPEPGTTINILVID